MHILLTLFHRPITHLLSSPSTPLHTTPNTIPRICARYLRIGFPVTTFPRGVMAWLDNLRVWIGGDASMRYLAASQDPAMAALKDAAPPAPPPPGAASRGRNNYALHGVLRTKPGRADSPPTRCMSCSDKLAAWNVLGVQGALAASLFAPVYVTSVILGDIPRDLRPAVREDCERALYGRLKDISGKAFCKYPGSKALN